MDRDAAEETALTEAAFRIANERMFRWEERHRDGRRESYFCECALEDCRATIKLGTDEYEAVRRYAQRFVVVPRHVIPELEVVVGQGSGYEVIEKPRALHDLLAQADPRRSETGPATAESERRADALGLDGISDGDAADT